MLLSDHHRYHQRRRLRRALSAVFEWAMAILFMIVIALFTAAVASIWISVVALVP